MIVVIPSNCSVTVPSSHDKEGKASSSTVSSLSLSSYSDDTTSSGGSSYSDNDHHYDEDSDNTTIDDQNDDDQENIVCSNSDENSVQQRPRQRERRTRPRRNGKKQQSKQNLGTSNDAGNLALVDSNMYVAMDCEMVGVGYKGRTSSIARVSIVDWVGYVMLDVYVRQDRPVIDYRTQYSGITPSDIEEQGGAVSLAECRSMVSAIIQEKILIGHGLKNDLRALGICHPLYRTRDTAKYEPFMKVRFDDGILWPRKLRDLVWERLKYDIQTPDKPHNPVEDAKAALGLYKSVRSKFEKVMKYKIDKTNEIKMQQQ